MKNIKKLFHRLSYLQYPLVLIAFILLIKPLFKGFDYLSSNPEYLFNTYSNALIFFGVTLSFSALQDPTRTSLRLEKKIWQNPKKAKLHLSITLITTFIFFASGLWGFIISGSYQREFAFASIILAIGLLGYLKFQIEVFEAHRESVSKTDITDWEKLSEAQKKGFPDAIDEIESGKVKST